MAPPPWAFVWKRGLRELVLWSLSEKSMNGAEIIRAIEEYTWGFWRPSPGSVYPLLKQLEAEGLVSKREDGRYVLTEAGKNVVKKIPWLRGPRLGGPRTIEETVDELESLALYIVDLAALDRDKVAQYCDRLKKVAEALSLCK
ncbi:MAG: PadR family transcriptional regulator [Pyrobaculum sp.]